MKRSQKAPQAFGHPNHSRRSGFSLVEVVLALGIVAFVLVSLLGLLSVGLNSSRESVEETLSGQLSSYVYQELATDAFSAEDLSTTRVSPFNPGNTYPLTKTYYFTRDGQFISYTNPPAAQNPFFLVTAVISIPASGLYPNISTVELRSAVLTIAWPVNGTTVPAASSHSSTFSFLLSKPLYRKSLEGTR